MNNTELNTLHKQTEVLRGKRQQEAKKQQEDETLLFERAFKLADVCEENLIEQPQKSILLRKAKCPRCNTVLTSSDIHGILHSSLYSNHHDTVFYVLHFTCSECNYEYAKKKGWPAGFS